MEALAIFGTLLAAVITAVGAIWLDRHFQQIDFRRDIYLELLQFIDNLFVWVEEQIIKDTTMSRSTMHEFQRRLNDMNAKVALLGSKDVVRAFKAYTTSWEDKVGEEGLEDLKATAASLDEAFSEIAKRMRPARDELVKEMRADLQSKPWSRRKV